MSHPIITKIEIEVNSWVQDGLSPHEVHEVKQELERAFKKFINDNSLLHKYYSEILSCKGRVTDIRNKSNATKFISEG